MVPRRWSACLFFRNRRGYCCTNAHTERSFMLEGLAGQAASAGPRTGSCCCSCKSAISVGETRCLSAGQLCYTVPVLPDSFSTLFQCLQTAPLLCPPVPPDSFSTLYPGASRRLFYTVSVPPDSSSTLSPGRCVTLLLPVLLASARFCRGAGWGVREAGWKHG